MRTRNCLTLVGVCFCLVTFSIQAQSWSNISGGSWGTGANWQGGVVPNGASLVTFTNAHAGSLTVTLDGNRVQTNSMFFGNGDWSVQPGTPGTSTLTLVGGSILTVSNGVTAFGVAGPAVGGGAVVKRGSGELQFSNARQFTNSTPSVEAGILRLTAGGTFKTGPTIDTYCDDTGTLIVDGGKIDTKIVRLGQSVMANGARFRMLSGTVNCGGSGSAVLLIGYNSGTFLQGSAYADIMGGTFSATGAVSDAGIYIGDFRPGTLTVTGTNGVPAAVNVASLGLDWSQANLAVTNVCVIGSNAVVSASLAVFKQNSLGRGDLYLQTGGTLRTPTVCSSTGPFGFHFGGGKLELTAQTNTLFTGAGMSVSVDADSELANGTNTASVAAPFTGSASLAKTGSGMLLFSGDQTGFAGTLAVQNGALVVTNMTAGASMTVRMSGGTSLDLTSLPVLVPNLRVDGNATVAAAATSVTLSSLTLTGGTLTLPNLPNLTVLTLAVPAGANVTLSSAGTVAIGALTGGGTLTVAGGGTFAVVNTSAFTAAGGTLSAEAGTTLSTGAATVSQLTVSGNRTISPVGTLTVSNLVLSGGTLTVAGGGELALGTVTVNAGVSAGFVLTGGSVVTNVASLTLGAGSVFQPQVASGSLLSVGAATGTGTLRLDGGTVAVGALDTGMSFDIQSGNVTVQPLAGPDSVTYTSGNPAFWVDASEAGSLVTVGGKLEWRDKRYSVAGPYDMKATATNVQPTVTASEPNLNNRSVVCFASPSSLTYKGMVWNRRLTEMRTIFWVVGAQEGGGGLIGDETLIDFLRGEVPAGTGYDVPLNIYYAPLFSLKYASSGRDHLQNVQNGVTRINGQVTDAFRNGFPTPDYHIVSLRTSSNTVGEAFASERTTRSYDRSGCQRLAEALVFTNALTDAEIAATESYLQKKWFATSVRANTVRIGSVSARFAAVGGKVIVNELQAATPNLSPTNYLSGVDRIERLTVSASGVVLGNAARTALPYDVGELRVQNGVTVTLDTAAAGAVWLGALSGTGSVAVAGGTSLEIGGAMTAAGDDLTLACPSVPLTVRSWNSAGALRISGATMLKINSMDLAGSNALAYLGAGSVQITNDAIRSTGSLNLMGNLSLVANTFSMNQGNQTLNLDNGGRNVQVGILNGNGTLARTGTGTLNAGQVNVTGASFAFACGTFANPVIPLVDLIDGGFSVTGSGQLTVGTLRTDTQPPRAITLASGVSATVSNLIHTAGTLTLPTNGTLAIVNLTPSGDCPVAFPSNTTTVVRTLATTTNGRVVLLGGTLQVLSSISNVQRFSILNQGLILPDGTVLTPALFDVASAARIDLGAGSALTLNVVGQAFSNGVTFVRGAVNVNESLGVPGTLRLEGTAVSVAAGKTLTAAALTGNGPVTVAAGSTLTIPNLNGYDGVLVNQGGALNVSNDRIYLVPTNPVVSPTFWVDASQSGSLTTNAQNKLVWLDKRTVRDGTVGLMSATSLSNMPVVLPGALNGLPVVDFGGLGTNSTHEKGMLWSSRLTNVRAVHWVIGVQNGGGQMLGDLNSGGGDIDYFRYSDGSETNNFGFGDYRTPLWSGSRFYTRHYVKNVVDGTTYMNGTAMTAPGSTQGFPSPDYHLLSLRTAGQTWAAAFASERVGNIYGWRSGGQRLGEVLVYDTVTLTAAQNRDNDAYLSWKWFAKRFPTYRVAGEDLAVLQGSGTVSGTSVLARELAPSAAGLTVSGSLYLDYYQAAASTGTVIRLAQLPVAGVAAVGVSGNVSLSTRGTVILGEARGGVFKVLSAGGTLSGAANIAAWSLDISAVPHASGYTFGLYVQDNAVMLKITAKGTEILVR